MFAQFLLRHLLICACCSTALLRGTPAPPACAPSCPQAVWMWQAQPLTWAGIPGLFELSISSGSGTASSSLAALASWERTRGKRVPVWKTLDFSVAVSRCWVTLNLLPCLQGYTEWFWVHWHKVCLHIMSSCSNFLQLALSVSVVVGICLCVWRPLQFLIRVVFGVFFKFSQLYCWKVILFLEKYF